MDLQKMRELLMDVTEPDRRWLRDALTAERYYVGDNDIHHPLKVPKPWLAPKRATIRQANNRIACNYYNFLVNQKAVYTVGNPPRFDSGSGGVNERISGVLGSHWRKTCKNLCINASNDAVAWLHSWVDEEGAFHYGIVDSKQIKAVWGGTLSQSLLGVRREYRYRDPDTGDEWDIAEYWDDSRCYSYRRPAGGTVESLEENPWYVRLNPDTGTSEPTNEYEHGFSKVPFTAFFNNQFRMNDLKPIKGYIDTYDKVFSLFSDNLEDVQQIIFVLENMGGTNLEEFRQNLRESGCVKVLNEDDYHTDLRTITIEIPVAASDELLKLARKNIFEQGQGVDPSPENYAGNTSGEALKYMYANLDQKCAAMRDEFEIGFEHFVGLLCEAEGIDAEGVGIVWGDPVRINNVTETITNIVNSSQILSERTQLDFHPMVLDTDEEIRRKRKEERERLESYPKPLTGGDEDGGPEEV